MAPAMWPPPLRIHASWGCRKEHWWRWAVADIASLSKLDFDNILVQFPDFAASIESHFHKWVLHCQACCFGLGGGGVCDDYTAPP